MTNLVWLTRLPQESPIKKALFTANHSKERSRCGKEIPFLVLRARS